jgi:hypothetical protein
MKENNELLTLLNNIYPHEESASTYKPMLAEFWSTAWTKNRRNKNMFKSSDIFLNPHVSCVCGISILLESSKTRIIKYSY